MNLNLNLREVASICKLTFIPDARYDQILLRYQIKLQTSCFPYVLA
jgi:hypothetical protein